MPGKGWRNRMLGGERPKTPQPDTAKEDSSANVPDNVGERSRPASLDKHAWRKTYADSRPLTPTLTLTIPQSRDDLDDTRSDAGSEATTPRRRSAPRPGGLKRLISGFKNVEPPKIEFEKYWDEEPLNIVTPVDPLNVIVDVTSAIQSYQPLSAEYHSGLLQVFEDYRKMRTRAEELEDLLTKALDEYSELENDWTKKEDSYQEEIRKLELIIAQGKTGMSALMRARRGTTVQRKRTNRQAKATSASPPAWESLTPGQLDDEIKSRTQKVVLHRPSSPSHRMVALSEHFAVAGETESFEVGTPPTKHLQATLSRRVKSELDLANLSNLGKMSGPDTDANSFSSSFSTFGDPLPDEADILPSISMVSSIECDAFVALRELAALVARRRGFQVESFLSSLMRLYSEGDTGDFAQPGKEEEHTNDQTGQSTPVKTDEDSLTLTPRRPMRHYKSTPFLSADETRRRHFSFEPGDDQLKAFNAELMQFAMSRPKSPAGSQSTSSSGNQAPTTLNMTSDDNKAMNTEGSKPSKIPSPLQRPALGHVRRENSGAGSRSPPVRRATFGRQDSSSSVRTAYRNTSNDHLRRPPSTRHSSSGNSVQRRTESQQLKERTGRSETCNSATDVALTAARKAGGARSSPSKSDSSSPARASTVRRVARGPTSFEAKGLDENSVPERTA